MPEITGAKRPVILYTPKLRSREAAGVHWFFLHVAALNVAKACKAVHERGHVIGDFHPNNWLIDRTMTAVVLGADNFQIGDTGTGRLYRCPVGTPDYTPRELFNCDFTKTDRTVEHDSFAMGGLIYLILMSKHPFSGGEWKGRGPAPSETSERIWKGQWLWGGEFRPKPLDIPLDALGPELAALMRRCFDDGHKDPRHRPTAAEWVDGLEKALDALAWCNRNAMHVYSGHRHQCTWCKLSEATSYDPFPTQPNIRSGSFDVAVGRFKEIQRTDQARAAQIAEGNPLLATYAPILNVNAPRKNVDAQRGKGRVFLNYRRADAEAWAGRLFERLLPHFPREEVFMDIDGNIPIGFRWADWLDSQVASCDLMLVVIGRTWAAELKARSELSEPDYVREEIESALRRKIPVVPVFVGDAPIPRRTELPETLRPLLDLQAVRLQRQSFDGDAEALVKGVVRSIALASRASTASEKPDVSAQISVPPVDGWQ